MKRTSRTKMAAAGLLGLLLAGGTASPAMAWGHGRYGDEGNTFVRISAGFSCEGRAARTCVNGPVNSGNTNNAQNVRLTGTPTSSGSPTSSNGSVNSGSSSTGASSHSSNHLDHTGGGGGQFT
ncbi:hypothetical protein ACWD4B_02255 [Streptomyces sp. NPDC002536]